MESHDTVAWSKQKVVMCKYNEMDKVLAGLNFGSELRNWIMAEAFENRDKQLCKEKVGSRCARNLPASLL